MRFFPFETEDQASELTILMNNQNSTEESKEVISKWIDQNWATLYSMPVGTVIPTVTHTVNETTVLGNIFQNELAKVPHSHEPNWEDEWFKMDPPRTTPYPWTSQCRNNKEFIRQQVFQFLNHRDTVAIYIEYMIAMSLEDKLITVEQSEEIRSIFWRKDEFFDCRFLTVDSVFRKEVLRKMDKSGQMKYHFNDYTARWKRLPAAGGKLEYDFVFNPDCPF
uniref:FBA_2 domain-containing protein n=1 Tax=Caenorhabditis tropicalis TaxID=1561998 RepID=A0A1I7TUI5_9PELO